MSWQERNYRDHGQDGVFRRAFRRIFAQPDNFFSWSIPLFRFSGITVRIHIFYILYIVTTMLWSVGDRVDFIYSAMSMGVLFLLVLLHEFGHCFACRWVGGEASEIVMWPLGGLAMCHPPRTWKASLITTVGGPMVNVILVPVLALTLLAMGASAQNVLLFNPFLPGEVLGTAWFNSPLNYVRIGVWWAYYINLTLLAFNVLLPMFPLDGGRIVQELMWSRIGYRESMLKATLVGLIAAVALGLFAMTARGSSSGGGASNLLGIALFAGITCYSERRRVQMMDEFSSEYDAALEAQQAQRVREANERSSRKQERQRETEAARQAEVDRILTKIREHGMGSLSRQEQSTLRGETERKRNAL